MHPRPHIADSGDEITIHVSPAALLDVLCFRELQAEAAEPRVARIMNPTVNADRLSRRA